MLRSKFVRHSLVGVTAVFCGALSSVKSASAATLTYTLENVRFTDGSTASGSFLYNPDTNQISNIDIVTGQATYTAVASTFPLRPSEFVFVPTATLTQGDPMPALVLFPSPAAADSVAVSNLANPADDSYSLEGVICHAACDAVTTSHQVEQGSLAAVPEPGFAPILGFISLALTITGAARPRRGENPNPR